MINVKKTQIIALLTLFFIITGGVFALLYERKSIEQDILENRNEILFLEKEISLLKIQVETLIEKAKKETQDEINSKIAKLEDKLSQEQELRKKLEIQLGKQNDFSKARIKAIEEDISNRPTLSSVISEWRLRTANIKCAFSIGISSGSGVLIKFNEEGKNVYGILTNRHVMVDPFGRPATSCVVTLPDLQNKIVGTIENGDLEFSTNGYDFGRIVISNPSKEIINRAAGQNNFCSGNVSLGDSLVIIGYPVIGAGNDVTATEGIISGIENDFYITSAKVEQGNSGGAAVLLKDSCLLGIPTFVQFGSLESLARILNINVLYK